MSTEPHVKSKEEIAKAYDSPPWWYDVRGGVILTFCYNSSLWRQVRFFGKNFGKYHLEVACGTGTLLNILLRFRAWKHLPMPERLVGIDYAAPMLEGAKRRFAKFSNVELLLADVEALPFADETFDTINTANSIHCFPDVNLALKEIHRVLKPGGMLAVNVLLYPRGFWPLKPIATSIYKWGIRKGILVTLYEQSDIRKRMQDSGFEFLSEKAKGNCYDVLVRKI